MKKNYKNVLIFSQPRLDCVHIHRLCTIPQIEKFVFHADLALYQAVLDYLIPDLLAKSMSREFFLFPIKLK